jgi:chemotaxis protein MotA
MIHSSRDPSEASLELLRLAESARKNGVISLERDLGRLDGAPFLAKGLTLVFDGGSADDVERMMRRELYAIEGRHDRGAGVLRKSAELAPAMGLIGTLIGLVQMLGHLDDPTRIGPGMAVALLTTFYGAVMSTLVFTPLAAKLDRNSLEESLLNQIYLLAITSIARQENPRRLELQINAMLPPAKRIRYFN